MLISFFAANMPNYSSRALPVRHHYRSTAGSYIHERDVPVHSTHSRTRSRSRSDCKATLSVKGVFVHNIQQITCSVTSHTRMLLARGLVSLWQDETVRRANSATLLWREEFQWTRNMSQLITWTRKIRSPKRFVQKERFVHERNITKSCSSLDVKWRDCGQGWRLCGG
jgi:hypothetical protein